MLLRSIFRDPGWADCPGTERVRSPWSRHAPRHRPSNRVLRFMRASHVNFGLARPSRCSTPRARRQRCASASQCARASARKWLFCPGRPVRVAPSARQPSQQRWRVFFAAPSAHARGGSAGGAVGEFRVCGGPGRGLRLSDDTLSCATARNGRLHRSLNAATVGTRRTGRRSRQPRLLENLQIL